MDAPLLRWSSRKCALALLTVVTVLAGLFARTTFAQIVPDTSLGDNSSSVIPEGDGRDRIEGGLIRETNLFHSFRDFNIEVGDRAYFASPNGIETILTRVTGNQTSNIFGTLGVLGEADLFLLNPNGIVFGPEAQLDIGGSFLVTSADAIQFGNQGLFSAANPQIPALLTVSPSALFFGNHVDGNAPGSIINRSVVSTGMDASSNLAFGLSVPKGESLLLVGGNVLIDGGGLNAQGGNIYLAAIAGPGQVNIVSDNAATAPSLSLNVPETTAYSDVILQNEALVNVVSDDRGSITLAGEGVGVLGGSRLFAGIASGLGDANSQSGDITLSANDVLTIEGPGETILNVLGNGAIGNAGGLNIEARDFIAQNLAFMRVATFGEGNAGQVSIRVQGTATLADSSTVFSTVGSLSDRQTAGISITANALHLLEGAELVSNVRPDAVGQAGGVRLNVRDAIVMDGVDADGFSSGIFATTRPGGVGFSGDVSVSANSLEITRGARIQTGTRGQGNSGNVTVEINDQFFLDGADSSNEVTGIFTDLDTDGVGRGGDIRVTAGSLMVNNGAQFTSNTFSRGDAGNITVDVQGAAVFDGVNTDGLTTDSTPGALALARSGLSSAVGESLGDDATVPAFGNAGKIILNANSLSLINGAAFGTSVASGSVGNAAPILVTVDENVVVSGENEKVGASGIFTEVRRDAVGNASNIEILAASLSVSQGGELSASIENDGTAGVLLINTRSLEIDEGGQIAVVTSGAGDAGNILIEGGNSLDIRGEGSGLFANSTVDSTGNGGSIFLSPNVVTIRDGAQIAVDSQSTGEGGDIQLTADSLLLANDALISAETVSSQGGDITLLVKDAVILRNGSNLSATAGTAEAGGNGGNITIGTDFLLAVPDENSNITANAFLGRGGNVQITATGIYGIESQSQELPNSNDITASSSFGVAGVVKLDTLELDPTRGIVELPSNTDIPQISQRCQAGEGTSRFVATGRGGIPLGPEDAIAPQDLWTDPNTSTNSRSTPAAIEELPIIEAQSWQIDPDGTVQLIAAKASSPSFGNSTLCSLSD